MTGLLIGITLGIAICYKLGYYEELIARFRTRHTPDWWPDHSLPNHLSCGQCLWLLPAAFPENRTPDSLCDQLIISPFCEVHNTFAWKRWNEKHLDDKGIVDNSQSDVDNYRGFLE